jgi:lipopolysaccharide transport system permease protein
LGACWRLSGLSLFVTNAVSAPSTAIHTIVPARAWAPLRLGELWEYRELLYFLVWREIKIRYQQTALGVAWAIIQPVFTMVVFSIFFGRLARVPSDGVPYPVFAFCALLPWQLFAFSLAESSNSVVSNQRLVTKVYFPRLVMPLAALGVGLIDFVITFILLLLLAGYYGIVPGLPLLTIPLWTLLAVMTALAVGLWLSALNVRYRDVRHTVPFLIQIWLFATPVAYPTSLVPEQWRALYALNPMVGVVDGFRWAVLGTSDPPRLTAAVSVVTVMLLMTGGLFYFRRMERTFADLV